MNTIQSKVTFTSRWLLGGVAAAFVALASWSVPTYAAGTAKDATGKAICDFSSFSYDATTNTLTVSCTSAPTNPDPNPPAQCNTALPAGTFSFWQPSSSAASGATTDVQITRSNAMNCPYTFTWTVSASAGMTVTVNGSSATSGTITFADQDYAVRHLNVVGTGALDGTVTLTLTGGPANGITPFGTHTISVKGSGAPSTGGSVTKAGCATSATTGASFVMSNQKIVFQLKPGETGAASFTPTIGGLMTLSTTETVNTPAEADHEVTISPCPGDFTEAVPAACRYTANYVGSSRWANIAPYAPWQCAVNPGQEYFMNVRHVKLGTTINSCNGPGYLNGACEVRLQITGGLPGN